MLEKKDRQETAGASIRQFLLIQYLIDVEHMTKATSAACGQSKQNGRMQTGCSAQLLLEVFELHHPLVSNFLVGDSLVSNSLVLVLFVPLCLLCFWGPWELGN